MNIEKLMADLGVPMKTLSFTLYCLSLGCASFFASTVYASSTRSVDVTFTNKLIDGKKTWVMASPKVKLTQGTLINAKLVNTLDGPHGFEVPGLLNPMVVKGKETKMVEFGVRKGKVQFKCHIHPAHVGGSFEVL